MSYLILLSPVVLFADTIIPLAYLTVLCWLSMYRREKVLVVVLVAPFIVAGFFDVHVRLAAVLSDPKSLTSLVDRANTARADEQLVQTIERAPAAERSREKNLALGLLYLKDKTVLRRVGSFFQGAFARSRTGPWDTSISETFTSSRPTTRRPSRVIGRRRASIPRDPICQYNLAQAYIKTLLMKEASRSLQAAGTGVEREKSRYAEDAFDAAIVLPETLFRRGTVEALRSPKRSRSTTSAPPRGRPSSRGFPAGPGR